MSIAIAQAPTTQSSALGSISIGASPATVTNTSLTNMLIWISGGTVSLVTLANDGVTFLTTGIIAGTFMLPPGGAIKITYVVIPSLISALTF